MLQGYRGNEIREEDKKLKAMKEEERKKQQETAKILQGYRSSGISEEERKLKAMKEEERKKQQEAESLLHSFKKTEEPEAKSRPQRKEEHSYPEPVNKSPSQQNDIMYISPGSVAEKKKSYSSQYQPSGPDLPVLPMAKNLQNAPFMEIVDEEETQGDMNGYNNTVGDEATEEMIDPETEITEIPKKDELQTEIEATVSSAESETEERVDEDTSKDNSTVNKEEENAEKTDASMGLDNVEERFDVCFSFGIVTDKDSPLLTTYMGAVNAVMKESIPKADPSSSIRYDPTHQPYVIDEKLDSKYRLHELVSVDGIVSY